MILLLRFSLSGSAAFLVIALLSRLLRRALRPTARYYLLLIPLILFWLPLGLQYNSYTAPAAMAAVENAVSEPPALEGSLAETAPMQTVTPAETIQQQVQTAIQTRSHGLPLSTLFTLAWGIGVGILFLQQIWTRFCFFRNLRVLRMEPDSAVAAALTAQGVSRRVQLYMFRGIASPFTVGMLRPQIWMPETGLDNEGLRYALAHELTHVRRFDLALRGLFHLTAMVHWFNPLAWLLLRQCDRLCELSCDEAVTRDLDARARKTYGRTLLMLMKAGQSAVPACMAGRPTDIETRLKTMLQFKKRTRLMSMLCTALTIALLCSATAAAAYTSHIFSGGDGYWETDEIESLHETENYGSRISDCVKGTENFPQGTSTSQIKKLLPSGKTSFVKVGNHLNFSADLTVTMKPSSFYENPDLSLLEKHRYEIQSVGIDRWYTPVLDRTAKVQAVQGRFTVLRDGKPFLENATGYLNLPFDGQILSFDPQHARYGNMLSLQICSPDREKCLRLNAPFGDEANRFPMELTRKAENGLTNAQWSNSNLYKYGLCIDEVKLPSDLGVTVNSASYSQSFMQYNTKYKIGTLLAYMDAAQPGGEAKQYLSLESDAWQGMQMRDGKTLGQFQLRTQYFGVIDVFEGTMEVDARPGGSFTVRSNDGRYYFHGKLTVFDMSTFVSGVDDNGTYTEYSPYTLLPITKIN